MGTPTIGLRCLLSILIMSLFSVDSFSQKSTLRSFRLSRVAIAPTSLPPSNSISHIVSSGPDLWVGTSKGVGKSVDGGRTWQNYRSNPSFVNNGIFAITLLDDSIWASTGYDKELDDGSVQTGSGYTFSTDNGISWQHVNQTLDLRGDSILSYGINDSLWMLPVVVPEQNVTFDISLSPGTVWIASWASGLRKSSNNGQTWQRVVLPFDNRNTIHPADTLWSYAPNDTLRLRRIFSRLDPRRNNNFLAFSVTAIDNDTIWCGTAGGINKSTDGGMSWAKFTHRNQSAHILGDWVIAIDQQLLSTRSRIWITNWPADNSDEEFGVSFTDDGGRTWTNLLHGVRAYDFAFKDSIVYIGTDEGVFRTADDGLSFSRVSRIVNPLTRQVIGSPSVFSVGVIGDTVYVGTSDGIASTIDNINHQFGEEWSIFQTYEPVGTSGTSYAYPNPFIPRLEGTRIHFSTPSPAPAQDEVSIEIFDFGMNRVRTLIRRAVRPGATETDEIWDGTNDNGEIVANGVYFYRIVINQAEPLFGKILVLQ